VAALCGFGAAADGLDGFGVSLGVSGPGSLTLDLWFEPDPVIDALSPKNRRVLTPDWGHVGCWDRERLNRRSGQRASLLGCRAFSTGLSGHGIGYQLMRGPGVAVSKVTCGIDWAEGHHDIAVVDQNGDLVAKRRIEESVQGFAELTTLLAEAGDSSDDPIAVAIETPRGLLVAALRASGWPVYPINPMAVARYRERYSMSGKKSDHADAMVLANILRTDADRHRQLPADSDLARRIRVLARAHQDATWRRTRACNELRSVLREYYPGFLQAFAGVTTNLITREARAVLALAPTPTMAASLSKRQIAAALRRSGRQRGINALTAQIHAALQVPQLRQPAPLEDAMGMQALALLGSLDTECASTDSLGQAVITAFEQHPDHVIITSFPGLGDLTGARILGEIGDDRERFADARALKAFAGSAPVTRASGRSTTVTCRRVKNNRMAAVGFVWAFVAAGRDGSPREHYLARRARGDHHPAALRHLYNRMLGQLYHCLHTGQPYDRTKAYPSDTAETAEPLTAVAA
jgi:transposase